MSHVTMIPVEHEWPVGAIIRPRHGNRERRITSIGLSYAGPTYFGEFVKGDGQWQEPVGTEWRFDLLSLPDEAKTQ